MLFISMGPPRSRGIPHTIQPCFQFLLPPSRKMRAFFSLHSIALLLTATVHPAFGADPNSTPCYFVNGANATTHTPCFPDRIRAGGVSSCCYISNGDVCLDTGICLSAGGMAFQGACTDQDWSSGSCPHRCPDRKLSKHFVFRISYFSTAVNDTN